MANEIELKLSLPTEAAIGLIADPLLAGLSPNITSLPEQSLENQYFDTPDLQLNQRHAALRIRSTGTGWVQTLKTKGQAIAGLHQRGEWESELRTPELDWSLLPDDVPIDDAIKSQIQPLFKTDFQRHTWLIDYQGNLIELVLDQGVISYETGREPRRLPLCEIELELKQGEIKALYDVAKDLAARHPLVPCDINKAERGYRLVKPGLSFFCPADFHSPASRIKPMLIDALNRISRRWDEYVYGQDWWRLIILQRQTAGVTQLLQACGQPALPLLDQWQTMAQSLLDLSSEAQVCVGLFIDDNNNSRGLSRRVLEALKPGLIPNLSKWVLSNHLGQAMLALGEWLHTWEEPTASPDCPASVLQSQINQSFSELEQCEGRSLDQQLARQRALQGLAYCVERLHDERYTPLNQYINRLLVVAGMRHSEQIVTRIADSDSRAKLASWHRRLTVELRTLQDVADQL